jgi:hypothetical protein
MSAPQGWTLPRNHGLVRGLHLFGTMEWGCFILGGWDYNKQAQALESEEFWHIRSEWKDDPETRSTFSACL